MGLVNIMLSGSMSTHGTGEGQVLLPEQVSQGQDMPTGHEPLPAGKHEQKVADKRGTAENLPTMPGKRNRQGTF